MNRGLIVVWILRTGGVDIEDWWCGCGGLVVWMWRTIVDVEEVWIWRTSGVDL